MGVRDAYAETYLNTGLHPVASRSAYAEMYENIGLKTTPSGNARAEMYLNTGLALPPMIQVDQPQQGWGAPWRQEVQVALLIQDANAAAQMFLNTGVALTPSTSAYAEQYVDVVTP